MTDTFFSGAGAGGATGPEAAGLVQRKASIEQPESPRSPRSPGSPVVRVTRSNSYIQVTPRNLVRRQVRFNVCGGLCSR
jgi:hypothetical protein